MIPIHPEAVADDPQMLRWVMPAGTLGFVGRPAEVPPPLRDLYAAGVLVPPTLVEPGAVQLRIAPGRSWRVDGARVRTALQAALARPDGWRAPVGASDDDVLRAAAGEVLTTELGEYVAGHGGRIEILEVVDGRITIELGGACAGCPASGVTVQRRFEDAVRRRCPELREVVAREEAPTWRGRVMRLLPRAD